MDQTEVLKWIDGQAPRMRDMVAAWASINSHSGNPDGLARLAQTLTDAFAPLRRPVAQLPLPAHMIVDSTGEAQPCPLGKALHIRAGRPNPRIRVFLGIHMDTVYPADHPFQQVTRTDDGRMIGPGVTDAKGGLAVLLTSLLAFEQWSGAAALDWEVLLNPDEEIGSPGSSALLAECAAHNDVGMVFEPALASGAFASQRKGSGNFAIVVRGQAAHAGREIEKGRNALAALMRVMLAVEHHLSAIPGCTVNLARVEGGGPSNVVPDLAIGRLNVRLQPSIDPGAATDQIAAITQDAALLSGCTAVLHGHFNSPPKPVTPAMQRLMEHVEACAAELDQPVAWEPTGGVCDGNRLAAGGLPTVDTLGVRGGNIHSPEEYLQIDSLTERAKLATLLLMRLAEAGWVDRSE